MRKGKGIISICATLLIMLLAIAGCGKKENITGKWVFTDETGTQTMEFFSDGTGTFSGDGMLSYSYEWVIENGRLKLETDTGIFGKISHVYDYELDGDTLTLSDEDGVYTSTRE